MHLAKALVELQETDLEILRSEKRLDSLPEKVAILKTRHKQVEVGVLLGKAKAYVAEIGRAQSRDEDETATLTEKMAAEQAKLTSGEVSDHKQVALISREIDALRRRKEKLEMETVALMEKAEKADRQVATIEAAIATLVEQEAALVERFKVAGGAVIAEIDALRKRRAALAKALGPDLLATYEHLRQVKNGIGCGLLDDRTCGACGVELPADSLHVLKDGPDVGECPMCKRILVVRLPSEDS